MGKMMSEASQDEDVEILKPATRDSKGRLLPGQRSINPAGRPAIVKDIRQAARSHTRQALNTLISTMNDLDAPAAARISAATAILDRGWGRPQQNIEARVEVADMAKAHADALIKLTNLAREAREERSSMIDVTPSYAARN
jgi:hypothetical protein